MMIDMNSLPVSGGIILSAAVWAGLSFFALGPVVAEREIAKSGWLENCEAGLKAELNAKRSNPQQSIVPNFDCNNTFGAWLGKEGNALCRKHGNFDLPIPGLDHMRAQERAMREAENQRITLAASKAGSRCSCAASHYTEKERLSFALYAGSARLITPMEVKNQNEALGRALAAPVCAMKRKG